MMSGTAALAISTTATITHTAPVATGNFWADGFWSAGFWADGFWGVFEQPYTKLKLGQQIFVCTELAKHYAISVSHQIIAFAEKHEVSVLTAMGSLNVCTQELRITATQREYGITAAPVQPSVTDEKDKPARCYIRSNPARIDVAVLLPPNEVFVARSMGRMTVMAAKARQCVVTG